MKISAINMTNFDSHKLKNKDNKLNFTGFTQQALKSNTYNDIKFEFMGVFYSQHFSRYSTMTTNSTPEEVMYGLKNAVMNFIRNHDKDKGFERTAEKFNTNIYIADPNEVISAEIRAQHGYIVTDNEPMFPSLEALKNKYLSTTEHPHDYFSDLRKYRDYQTRVINTDNNSIDEAQSTIDGFYDRYFNGDMPNYLASPEWQKEHLENRTKKDIEVQRLPKLKKRVAQAQLKSEYADKISKILEKSGNDFVDRDRIAREIDGINKRLSSIDEYINRHLQNIDDTKANKIVAENDLPLFEDEYEQIKLAFQNPENKDKIFKFQVEEKKQALEGLKSQIKMMEDSISSYTREVNDAIAFKNNAPEMLRNTQNQFQELLARLKENYTEIENFYINNNLRLL